jgi:hypothetical protein
MSSTEVFRRYHSRLYFPFRAIRIASSACTFRVPVRRARLLAKGPEVFSTMGMSECMGKDCIKDTYERQTHRVLD